MQPALTTFLFAILLGSTDVVVAGEASTEKFDTVIFGMPAGMIFASSGPTDSRANTQLQPGVELIPHPKTYPSGKVYDVKGWLDAMGMIFPEGSEALYFLNQSMVMVRNTEENLVDFFGTLNGLDGEGFAILWTEITLVTLNRPAESLANPAASFDRLKKGAGDSWQEIVTSRIVSKAAQIVRSQTVLGQKTIPVLAPESDTTRPASVKAPDLPSGAEGTTSAIRVVVGPDGQTIDAALSFRLRTMLPGLKEPLTIRFDGDTTLQDGYPQVLQLLTPTENGPAFALILRITRVLPATAAPLGTAKDVSP